MKRMVLFHADCPDGFTAAWAAYRRWGYEGTEYVPVRHNAPPPDVADAEVWMVDFSYHRPDLLQIADVATEVHVLDHHQDKEAELDGFANATMRTREMARVGKLTVVFDNNRSGAGIAWDEIMRCPRPWVVDYAEDRDLWRHALPGTREANAWIGTTEMTFAAWDALAAGGLAAAVSNGAGALRFCEQYVAKMRLQARRGTIAGHAVPIVNAPYIAISELVGALAEHGIPDLPSPPFAAGWFQRGDGKYVYSLRARKGDFDVSQVAALFDGGGHKAAAGFSSFTPVHVFDDSGPRPPDPDSPRVVVSRGASWLLRGAP